MTHAMRHARSISMLMVATLLAGCGLFATREPENPLTAGSQFEPPTTPTIVLRNLESALNYANPSDYRKCFSDTSRGLPNFVFLPSVQGMSAAPTKFERWGIQQEEDYIRNLFAELSTGNTCNVIFNPPDVTDVPFGDSVRFTATYTASFPHTRTDAEREAEGSLEFTFRLSRQNEWYISQWRDISRSDKPSWSLIKARFIDP